MPEPVDSSSPVRRAKTLTVLAACAATATVLFGAPASGSVSGGVAPAASGSGPAARSADESLVRYLTEGRLPTRMKCPPGSGAPGRYRCIFFFGECSADCKLVVRMKLVLPDRVVGPVRASTSLDADVEPAFQSYLGPLTRPTLRALRRNWWAARFRTRIRATDIVTGEVDVDRRTFRFKRPG